MKILFKKIIAFYLKILSKIVLIKHKPDVIAIAGSTGKHCIKQEIAGIFSNKNFIRVGPKKYNAELGVPLTIFGLVAGSDRASIWCQVLFRATKIALFSKKFPKKIILELGVSHPNDMEYYLSIVSPNIVILTNINTQYLDNFKSMDMIAEEYLKLVRAVDKIGTVILCNDDRRIKKLKTFCDAKVITYGLGEGSDFRATNLSKNMDSQSFALSHDDISVKESINRFGVHHIYAKLIGEITNRKINKQ